MHEDDISETSLDAATLLSSRLRSEEVHTRQHGTAQSELTCSVPCSLPDVSLQTSRCECTNESGMQQTQAGKLTTILTTDHTIILCTRAGRPQNVTLQGAVKIHICHNTWATDGTAAGYNCSIQSVNPDDSQALARVLI